MMFQVLIVFTQKNWLIKKNLYYQFYDYSYISDLTTTSTESPLQEAIKDTRKARYQWLMPITPYAGGRDQENCGSKPSSLQDPISKKSFTKKGWWTS
jgi:hypothetical protein